MSTMVVTGVAASCSASVVNASAAIPGAMTGRAPKRSTQPPTVGRRNIDTTVMTEKSRPTCVFVPPRSATCSGNSVLSTIEATWTAAVIA